MGFIRKLLGTEPRPNGEGSFEPSRLALKMATSPTTDFDGGAYSAPYTGGKARILMVCTQERDMLMANGKKFSTGNHPVEMALPMLHLLKAGFEIDVATPTGEPVVLEMWAMPTEDKEVMKLISDFGGALKNPISLVDFVADSLVDDSDYVGVFIPGGHGAMLGLPEDPNVGRVLRWAHEQEMHTITLCHGPGVLMAAKDDADDFIYDGYDIIMFPDSVDKQTPMVGYLPGHMPWMLGERLKKLGFNVINKKADDTCHVDRRLITGASPQASNNLGRLAAETLLENVK